MSFWSISMKDTEYLTMKPTSAFPKFNFSLLKICLPIHFPKNTPTYSWIYIKKYLTELIILFKMNALNLT